MYVMFVIMFVKVWVINVICDLLLPRRVWRPLRPLAQPQEVQPLPARCRAASADTATACGAGRA